MKKEETIRFQISEKSIRCNLSIKLNLSMVLITILDGFSWGNWRFIKIQ